MVSMKSRTKLINSHHLTIALVVILGVLTHRNQCAPAVEEEDVEGGCYYMFNHYGEGDRILTNEPCLNCTCHNSMLMCYLRVCPFTKPIGQDCTIEKKPDQCCPVINCPQVPVSLVTPSALVTTTSTTTAATVPSSELATVERGCEMDGKYYADGAQVASDPNKPCELCYCIRNRTACVMQECILHVEGCRPIFEPGVCCPVRYQCDAALEYDATTTTTGAGIGGLLSTTISSILGGISSTPQPGGCVKDGEYYADGSQIPNLDDDPCNHCYCMRGDIVCAVQECGSPLENEGGNCTAVPPRAGLCCPEQYACHDSRKKGKSLVHSNESTEVPEDVTSPTGGVLETVTPSLTPSVPSEVQSEPATVIPNVPQEEASSAAPSGESIQASTEPSSLEAEATTVHVAVVKPEEGVVPSEGQTGGPAQHDETVAEELGTTTPRTSNTSPLSIHEIFPEQSTSAPAGQAENLVSSTPSAPVSAAFEPEGTGKPEQPQEDISEKISPTMAGVAEPQTTTVPELPVEASSQASSSTGTSADMLLTTTPAHSAANDEAEQVTVSGVSTQPTPVVSSSVPQTTSTEIIASTPLPEQNEGLTEAVPTSNVESSSTSPAEIETSPAAAAESEASEAAQDHEHVIHMTTPREELPADQESATSLSPASLPEESSSAPVTTAAAAAEEATTSAPVQETTILASSTTSSTTAGLVSEKEVPTTVEPAAAEQEPATGESSSSTSASPVTQAEETTAASVGKEVEEIGLTTVSPLSPSSPESSVPAATESSVVHDESEAATTVSASEGAEPVTPVASSSVAPESETSNTAAAAAVPASEASQVPEATTLPSAGTEEEHTLTSIAADAAASSVATERIVPTTSIGGGSEQTPERTTLKPESESSSSAVPETASPVVSEAESVPTEAPASSSSPAPEPVSQAVSTTSPAESQEPAGSTTDIEDRISQGSVTTAKPVFVVATTEDHMVIIPEQVQSQQHIPVMPLQRENQTSTAAPVTAEEKLGTSEPSSTAASVPEHHDENENVIHDETDKDELPLSSAPVEVTTPRLSSSTSEIPEGGEHQEASTIVSVQTSSPSTIAQESSSSSPAALPEEAASAVPVPTTVAAAQEEQSTSSPVASSVQNEPEVTTTLPETVSSTSGEGESPASPSGTPEQEQSATTPAQAATEQAGPAADQPSKEEIPLTTLAPEQEEPSENTKVPAPSESSTTAPVAPSESSTTAPVAPSESSTNVPVAPQEEQPSATTLPSDIESQPATTVVSVEPEEKVGQPSSATPEQSTGVTSVAPEEAEPVATTVATPEKEPTQEEAHSVPATSDEPVAATTEHSEQEIVATTLPSQQEEQPVSSSSSAPSVPEVGTTVQPEEVPTTIRAAKPDGAEEQAVVTTTPAREEPSSTFAPTKESPAADQTHEEETAAATTLPSEVAPAEPSQGTQVEQVLTTTPAPAEAAVETTVAPPPSEEIAPSHDEGVETVSPAENPEPSSSVAPPETVAPAQAASESSEGIVTSTPSSVESGSTEANEVSSSTEHVEYTTSPSAASEQEEGSTASSVSSSSSSSSTTSGSSEPVTTEESRPSVEGVTSTESTESHSSTENTISSSSSSAQVASDETIEATTAGSLEQQEVSTTGRNTLVTGSLNQVTSGSEESTSAATTESEEVVLTDAPGVRIPGEGSCFVEGVSYRNGSHIPPSTPCQITCACQNSIVHCLLYHCAPAPSDLNCKPIYKPNVCCPEYDCEPASTVASVTVLPEATQATVTSESVENLVSGSTSSAVSSESSVPAVSEAVVTTSVPEVVTVQPDKPQELPPVSNLGSAPTQGPSGTTEEISVTTPHTAAAVTSEPVTSVHSQTEVSLVSSSASSSQVSSVSSVSGPTVNGSSDVVTETSATSSAASQPSPSIEEKLGTASGIELTPAPTTAVPSSSTSAPEELLSSQPPSPAQITVSENEIIPSAETIVANTSTTAGSKYPVTTTTTVTTSPAPWPYPSSSTMAPSVSSGACLFDGRVYMSAQQIPRDDPCDFCFCFRGDIICLQQSCPPPIPGCYEEPIPGFCCPRYECPVGSGNSTTSPPLFPPSYYHGQIMNGVGGNADKPVVPSNQMVSGPGCEIQGEYYETGQVIMATSGPCLECRCGSTGMMECDPRECQPEPMLRKMIAAISSRR